MKIFLALTCLVILVSSVQSQYCKKPLLNSYSLDGELTFTTRSHPICTTIKKNCCTGNDVKKILGSYNGFLQPKMAEFRAKMQQAFKSLRDLNYLASSVIMRTDLTGPQQTFCAAAQTNFTTFPFQQLIDDLVAGFAVSSRIFRQLHSTFFCALCDYEAQQSISLETRSIALDSSTCLNVLASNRLLLSAQNINLIQYFQYLQNYLDCNLSTDRFDFPFVFTDRLQNAQTLKTCYQTFDPDVLTPECAQICSFLGTGTISPVFEGDFDFISQASSFFSDLVIKTQARAKNRSEFNPILAIQKLSEANDSAPFIQVADKNKARLAMMPGSSSADKSASPTGTNTPQSTTPGTSPSGSPGTSTNSGNQPNSGTSTTASSSKDKATDTSATKNSDKGTSSQSNNSGQANKNQKKLRRRRLRGDWTDSEESQGLLSRFWNKLSSPIKKFLGKGEKKRGRRESRLLRTSGRRHGDSDASMKKILAHDFDVISRSQRDILKRLKKNFRRSSNDRILSDDGNRRPTAVPLPPSRVLAEAPADRPFSQKYYEQLYDSFSFQFDQRSTEFNPRRAPPFDIGLFTIQSTFGQGLNLGAYIGNMNWEISPETLEKLTRGSNNLDEADPNLTALLFYFDATFGPNMNTAATTDFAITLEAEALSPDDTTLKSLKPPAYETWELFDSASLSKYIERSKANVFQVAPQQPVAPVDSVFHNHIAHIHSRRLRHSTQTPTKATRRSWVQRHQSTRTKRHSPQNVADARLHRQMLRSEGFGHGRKLRHAHNRPGRQLSSRFLLENVEGDLNIQPWLNV